VLYAPEKRKKFMSRRKPVVKGRDKHLGVLALLLMSFFSMRFLHFINRIYSDMNEIDNIFQGTKRKEPSTERSFPIEWMANIHDSMFYYTKNESISISSYGLNQAYHSLRHGLFLRVENNSVYAKSKTVYHTPWEASFEAGVPDNFFCRMYFVLCSLEPDIDVDIIYSHADESVGFTHNPYPAFSWVKSNVSTDILVPYGEAWGGVLKEKPKNCDVGANGTSWNKKIGKGIWRGSNTGIQLDKDWKHSPRGQLVIICNAFPDLCDAGFTQYVNGRIDQIQEMKNSLGIVDMLTNEEQETFKYAIVADGNSAPSSRMKSQLESGSLTMKQTSVFKEFFYSSLQPYVHFLPLRTDFQDLAEKIVWASKNDDLAQEMVQNARKFSCKWFNSNSIHSYLLNVFKEYVKRFRGIKATSISTSEMTRIKINSLRQLEQECGISRDDFEDKTCKLLTGV